MNTVTTNYPVEAGTGRPLGFPQEVSHQYPVPSRAADPPRTRDKGSLFVGSLLFGITAFLAYNLFDSFFRYEAYGTVVARTIGISPPWVGAVRTLHVREGDRVVQGQALITLENMDLKQRHSQLADEIALAQADLEAQVARLKWEAAFGIDQGQGAVAIHSAALGELLREESELEGLRLDYARPKPLVLKAGLLQAEFDIKKYELQGKEQKVIKLREAVGDLKRRAVQSESLLKKNEDLRQGLVDSGRDRLSPYLVKIKTLQAEQVRVLERLKEGQITSPTNGSVARIHRFPGERSPAGEVLLTILEDDSLEIILYIPQSASKRLAVGDRVSLVSEPDSEPIEGVVRRSGDVYESPPDHLARHYWQGQKLLPLHLKAPGEKTTPWSKIKVGSTVKLAYNLNWFRKGE